MNMTKNPINSWEPFVAPLLALGLAGAAASSVLAPNLYAPSLAATGGVLLGAHVALERRRVKYKSAEEAAKVGKVFSVLYETNRGLINPDQLSYLSDITIEKADNFLAALSTQQGGEKVQTERGIVYSFPHTENILDTLVSRAAVWADQQTEPILRENSQLKQNLIALQGTIRINSENAQKNAFPRSLVENPTKLNNNKEVVNPWNSLL